MADAIVCWAVGGAVLVTPGSARRRCSSCGVAVWLSPSSFAVEWAGARVLCFGCASEAPVIEPVVLDATLDETSRALGRRVTRDEALAMIRDELVGRAMRRR